MKLFMLWDMEGVSGLFRREQVWVWEEGVRPEVAQEGFELITADVNSGVAAALEAGADEVIVVDTHRGGGNVLMDRTLRDPRVVYRGKSRGEVDGRLRWLPDLDASVDGFLCMGHHAKAGTPDAFLPHTWQSDWADFRINGMSVGEIGIEACFAGYWDVPLIMVQGEDAGCREAAEQFPGVITASVKRAVGRDTCEGPEAAEGRRLTAEKLKEAVARIRTAPRPPFKPQLPMAVSIRLATPAAAAAAAERPGVLQTDSHTVERRLERQCDVVSWIVRDTGL